MNDAGRANSSTALVVADRKSHNKPGGCAGVFFQLFEWNRKFAKKLLFSRKVLPPARPKQACKKFGGHEKMPMAKFLLIADENSGGFPSAMKNGVQGGDYEKTLQKNQMGAPSLVARLMGLETMPVVRQGNPKRETSYGMDELNRTSREACSLDREGKRMESRPQKLQKTGVSDRHAVTRFGADALQLKGVLTRSKKPHKQLATPVKSPRSISGRSGSRLIGAATKILEPGLQAKHRAKYTLTYSNYTRKGLHSEVMSEEKAVRYPELSKEFGHVESGPMPLNEQSSCRTCGNPLDVMEFSQNENSSSCSPQSSKCNNSELPTPYIEQQVNVVYPNEQIMHLAEAKGSPQKHLEQILDSMPPGKSPAEWQLAIQNYKPHQDASSTIASKYKAKCPKAANKERTPARSNQSDLQRKRGSPALGNSSGQKDYVTINRGLNAQARPKMHVRMDTCKQESEIRSCNTQDNSFSQPRALVRKRRPTNVGRSVSTGVTSSNSQNKKGGRCELRNGEEIQSNSGLVNRYSRKSRFARQSDDSNAAKSPGVVSFMFSSPVKHKIPSEEMEEMQRHSIQDNNFQDKRPVMDGYNGSMSSLRQIPFKGDILGAFLDQKLQELRHQEEEEVATNQPKKSSSVILQELLSVLSMEMPHSQDTLDCGNKEHSSQTTLNNEDVFQAEGKMKCISDRFPDNGCQFSPASVLEAPFSNDSCFSSSRDDSSGMRLHHGPISYFADKTVSVEPDYDLLDSATSSDKGGTGTHQMVTHLLNEIQRTIDSTGARFTGYRLNHAKQVILNTELFFQNSALQKSADDLLVQPILLDKLEALALTIFSSSTQNFEKTRDENQLKLFLVDSVVEYLDSKYVANYKLGYSTWRRFQLGLSVEMLIYEVGKEFRRWNQWTGKLTDEIIDSEMSHSLGKWTDFEIEAFEIGIEIGQDILLSLVDEVVIDLRHCMFGNF